MSQPSRPSKMTHESDESVNPTLLLFSTALSTTWRFFGPLLAGLFLGMWLDSIWHTSPIITAVLILFGAISAGWLIYKQLKAVH